MAADSGISPGCFSYDVGPEWLRSALGGRERIMESHFNFPMPLTIRCFKCGKVFEVALTSEERHEFPCPGCGEVEVYDLGAMIEKVAATQAEMNAPRASRF